MLKQQDLNQKITKSTDTKITIKVVSHVIKIINQKYFSHAGKYSPPFYLCPFSPNLLGLSESKQFLFFVNKSMSWQIQDGMK